MNQKVTQHHLQKPAFIYVRQSTMGQVRHHRESTERQYALQHRAQELGWTPQLIRVLDGDLGACRKRSLICGWHWPAFTTFSEISQNACVLRGIAGFV